MKQLILLITLCTVLSRAYSQTADSTLAEKRRVTVYYELEGNATLGSGNFDKIFLIKKRYMLSYRVGISASSRLPYLAVPAEINFLLGKGKHHLEIGSGLVFKTYYRTNFYVYREYKVFYISGTIRLGYRYQQPNGGLFINAGLVPSLRLISNISRYDALYSFFGIGIGYTFKG